MFQQSSLIQSESEFESNPCSIQYNVVLTNTVWDFCTVNTVERWKTGRIRGDDGSNNERTDNERMCTICGHLWCVRGCPAYVPEEDPAVTGECERCGAAVFGFGTRLCDACKEEQDDDQ